MADGFPCPNPTCTHTFAAGAVKGSAVLTCPRCGTVYKFAHPAAPRPTPPAAPRVAPPPLPPPLPKPVGKAAKVPPPLPPAIPVAPAVADVPVARAVHAERQPDRRLQLESSPEMVLSPTRRRRPRRGWAGWLRLAAVAVLVVGLCGAVGYAIYRTALLVPESHGDDTPKVRKARGNFAFDAPRGWKQDRDVQQSMRVGLAMTRRKPRNHFALFYKDYQTRTPSDAELLDEALKKLRNHFAVVHYEDPFANKDKGRTGTLGGEPAITFPFVAKDKDEVEMTGETYVLTRQGYAYWFFFWGPDGEEIELLKDGWANVRDGFTLYDQRDGWKPQPRQSERHGSDSGYQLDYVTFTPASSGEGKLALWRKEENPKEYDAKCELALKGFEPTLEAETGKARVVPYAGKLATVEVLILEFDGDQKNARAGYKFAEDYVLKKVQRERDRPDARFDPLTDKKTGKPQVEVDVGALRGQLSHLRVVLDVDNERYGLLAVAPLSGAKWLVVFCDCPFDRLDFWKQEFKAVIETLRRAKQE